MPQSTDTGGGCSNYVDTPSEPRYLYEYAVVRCVPRVEREEFINVGLVMMCKRHRWLCVRISLCESRLKALFPKCDTEAVREQLAGFERVAAGCPGPIGELEVHERFRWLTAVRSASLTTSRPHPGVTDDLRETFDRLYSELVDEF